MSEGTSLSQVIDQVSKDKNIDRKILVEALDKLDILGEGELVRIGEAETAAESMSERAEIREELREESLSSAYRTQVETTVSGDPFFGQFFT